MGSRLIVIWLLLGALVAAGVALELTGALDPEPAPPTASIPMFDFTEADLGGVVVTYRGRTGALLRNAEGLWLRHDGSHGHTDTDPAAPNHPHRSDPQLSAEIEQVLGATAERMLAKRRLTIGEGLAKYGLIEPALVIRFYGRGETDLGRATPLAVLNVGDLAPTELEYYAMHDGAAELSLVPHYHVSFLLAATFGDDAAPSAPAPSN